MTPTCTVMSVIVMITPLSLCVCVPAACDCSELSLSEECDIVSGQCQCQEGAMGLKCNDCAFGFFGNHHQNILPAFFIYVHP